MSEVVKDGKVSISVKNNKIQLILELDAGKLADDIVAKTKTKLDDSAEAVIKPLASQIEYEKQIQFDLV